jgi:hypothetical protein
MSSLWTPGGERPVGRDRPEDARSAPAERFEPGEPGEPTEEDIAALRQKLAETPAATIVINHCLGFWELAALHLSLQPPQLDEAAVAIDALGAVIDRLEGRLGADEATLKDALAQLRLAFVQVKAANGTSDAGE